MKHPDLIAELLIDVAAEHGHVIAGLTLQRSTLGPHKDFPCYTYGVEAIETIAGANWPDESNPHDHDEEDQHDAPTVTINIPEGYEAVTETVGEISTTTVRPVDTSDEQQWREAVKDIRVKFHESIEREIREALGRARDRG